MVSYKDIKDGDILHTFCPFIWTKPARYLSAAIRIAQKLRWGPEAGKYHHAAIAFWQGNKLYIYEADPQIKATLFQEWAKDKTIAIARIPESIWKNHGGSPSEIKTIAKSKIGTKYDYISLTVYQLLLIFTGNWYGSKNSNSFYCSEFTSWLIYLLSGVFHDWHRISPAKSYQKLKNHIVWTGKASDLKQ